jgi:NSS family neurotransmitter:Na+ symporter
MSSNWSSRLAFLLAAIGAAVGLGNMWKFPYVTGVSGGGAFVLVYLVAAAVVAIPVLVAELLIGRRGHRSPPFSMRVLAAEVGATSRWSVVGWLGVIAGYLILSYYSVIAGWVIAYVKLTASGELVGLDAQAVSNLFDTLLADPVRLIFWHTLFIAITAVIIAGGVQRGIERAVKLLMPALFGALLIMIGYSASTGFLDEGLAFLFRPDFSRLDGPAVLAAVGQAFFSIGVSMGIMMAYGAYMSKRVSIAGSAVAIAFADTLVAILAGLAIFPLVFANGLDPAEGPGLIFVTLPVAFAAMPGGRLFGTIFFLLLMVAAVTSAIAVLEPVVAWVIDRFGMRRKPATVASAAVAWIIGLASVFSFNIWQDFRPIAGRNLYEIADFLTANLMMPLGGLLIALFVGWRMRRAAVLEELELGEGVLFSGWRLLIRYVVPLAILAIFVAGLL